MPLNKETKPNQTTEKGSGKLRSNSGQGCLCFTVLGKGMNPPFLFPAIYKYYIVW